MKKAIPYYRVSSQRQGDSGLGLDAQRQAVREFAKANKYSLLKEYTEIESGKKNNRPILLDALEECQNRNAVLLIAKLDRLGRNVAFISALMESKVHFTAVDNPYATDFVLHIHAAFAQMERSLISKRTKEALRIAKLRGVKLGTNGKKLARRNKADAVRFAKTMKPIIKGLNAEGLETIRELVAALNERNISTASGGTARWHVSTVFNLLQLIKSFNNPKK